MPIDPNIALGVRPVQFADPVESYGKALSLRNLIQQQQLAPLHAQALQQQVDAGRMQNEAAQRDLQSDVEGRKLFATKDPTDSEIMATYGPVRGAAILKNRMEAHKMGTDIQETKSKIAAAESDYAGSMGAMIRDSGYDPQVADMAFNHAEQLGYGDLVKQMRASVQQNPASLQAIADHLISASPKQQQLANEKKTADARAATAKTAADRLAAETPGIQANNTLKGLQVAGQTAPNNQADWDAWRATLSPAIQPKVPAMYSPAAAEMVQQMSIAPAERKTLEGQAAGRAENARHNKIEESQGAGRLAISRQEQNLRQKQYDATYGALVGPDGKPLEAEAAKAVAMQDPLASAIANYQAAPPSTSRGGPGASIMRKVLAINPDYQQQNWQAQGGVLKDFTSGNTSKSLVAMSTALGHLGALDEAADALKNGDIRVLNALANRIGVETGATAATTFKTIVHRLGPEIEKAYVGGAGTGGERGKTEADFDPSLGNQQLKSNIKESAKLFRSKIAAEEFRWKQVMGSRPIPFALTPDADKTMQRMGAGATPPAPGGGSYAATATGKDGHKIGTNDNGKTWYDVQTGKKI